MSNKEKKLIVLVIDDDRSSLFVCQNLLSPFYEVHVALSPDEMFRVLESVTPDLFLLDIIMPDMDGYKVARKLKADERYAAIPIIFLTALDDAESEAAGFRAGAADFIRKPVQPVDKEILLYRIEVQTRLANMLREAKEIRDKAYNDLKKWCDGGVKACL